MSEKKIAPLMPEWRELSRDAPTITATVSLGAVTFSGTIATPQVVTITVNGKAFSYGVQPTDTLSSVASSLAGLISAVTPSSSTGNVVTIPSVGSITCLVGTDGVLARELRRTEKHFQITIWAPIPDQRSAAGKLIDVALSSSPSILLADGTIGRLQYVRTWDEDKLQNELCYRRDMVWSVEFGTIETMRGSAVTSGAVLFTK